MKANFCANPLVIGLLLSGLPSLAFANQSLVAPGYSATVGGVTQRASLLASGNNPASTNLLIRQDENLRLGYLANLGGYVELGKVDDLDLVVDGLVDDIDDADSITGSVGGLNVPQRLQERYPAIDMNTASAASYYEAIAAAGNSLLNDLEKGGQMRFGAQVQVPVMPILFRSNRLKGAFSLNASASIQGQGRFLGSPFGVQTTLIPGNAATEINLDLNAAAGVAADVQAILDDDSYANPEAQVNAIKGVLDHSGILTPNNTAAIDRVLNDPALLNSFDPDAAESELTTDSGLDVRAALITQLALGYGGSLTDWFNLDHRYGQLKAGLRLNLYQVETGRNFVSLQTEANSNDDDDVIDSMADDILDSSEKTTVMGVDLGLLWHADNYQAGVTVYNVNEPDIDYPDATRYLDANDGTLAAFNNPLNQGKTTNTDSVTLTRHAVLEAA